MVGRFILFIFLIAIAFSCVATLIIWFVRSQIKVIQAIVKNKKNKLDNDANEKINSLNNESNVNDTESTVNNLKDDINSSNKINNVYKRFNEDN